MTNSNRVTPSTNTGTEDQTTPDTAKFVSNKGTEFKVVTLPNGLFQVHMAKGGVAPRLCDELFTSRKLAEQALTFYIMAAEKPTGVAQYPSKGRNAKS